jgi:hypothetical protein
VIQRFSQQSNNEVADGSYAYFVIEEGRVDFSFHLFYSTLFYFNLDTFGFGSSCISLSHVRLYLNFGLDMERRQEGESSTDRFLDLIADPFQTEVSPTCAYLTVFPDCCQGPAKFYIRRYRLQLCSSWTIIPRFLLPATPELSRVCPPSQACG